MEAAFNDVKAAYVYKVDEIKASAALSDIWEFWTQLGDRATVFAQEQLEHRAAELGALDEVRAFQDTVQNVMSAAAGLSAEVHATAGVDAASVSDEIAQVLQVLFEKLGETFPDPREAPSHEERRAMVEDFYAKAEEAIVKVLVGRGMRKERVMSYMERLRRHVINLIVMTGDFAKQHPALLQFMLSFGSSMILPETLFLRPLLAIFGWGPYGPIKGSAAAWAQRYFFGASVEAGSWFAILQSAAMSQACGWLKVTSGTIFAGFVTTAMESICRDGKSLTL